MTTATGRRRARAGEARCRAPGTTARASAAQAVVGRRSVRSSGDRRGRRRQPRTAAEAGRSAMKPSPFVYHAPATSTRRSRLLPRWAPTARSSPAGRAWCRCSPCGSRRRRTSSTSTGSPGSTDVEPADDGRPGRRARPARAGRARRRRAAAVSRCCARRCAGRAPGRSATAARRVGSLAHADPAGEMTAVLALLGGEVEAASARRARGRSPPTDFFLGPLESSLRPGELAVVGAGSRRCRAGSGSCVRRGGPPARRLRRLRRRRGA